MRPPSFASGCPRKRDIPSLKEILWVAGILPPEAEYRFNPDRRWRFDYAYPNQKIAIEIEGGIWIRGRHSRGKGMLADMEKYNWATTHGWRVLRYAYENLRDCAADLKLLLG